MSKKQYFRLYACCILTEGYKRSIITDLQRARYFFISPEIAQFLKEIDSPLKELASDKKKEKRIKFFIEKMIYHEIGFITEEPSRFPKLNLNWESPHLISNAIIEFNHEFLYEYENIIQELNYNACEAMEIRFYKKYNLQTITIFLKMIKSSSLRSVYLYISYDPLLTADFLIELQKSEKRIRRIIIHSAPYNINHVCEAGNSGFELLYTKTIISSNRCCGNILPQNFSINISTYSESQNFNTCLNQKISIDLEGNYKNCPSMTTSFGNIKENTIREVTSKRNFRKYWKINKDSILICKDCEFRYICTDCRAFVEQPENLHSKPLKCGYDPYTNKWSDWSTNPLKRKAKEKYKLFP